MLDLSNDVDDGRREYLAEHNVEKVLVAAVSRIISERPQDPVAALGQMLIKPKHGFVSYTDWPPDRKRFISHARPHERPPSHSADKVHAAFKPCIDLHDGAVKQIVGSSLSDDPTKGPVTNFESSKPSEHYAAMYRDDRLGGGHVIMLGKGNEAAAKAALRAYPRGLQVGGGITPTNAPEYIAAGASHVIVTSYVFRDGALDRSRLAEIVGAVGRSRLVLDLSCRRREPSGPYFVVTDRWQKFTSLALSAETLAELATHCDEFLVHAVDVEGKQSGVQEDLVTALGAWSPIPVTYAGGARSIADLELVSKLGRGKVDLAIGSALDIFGGGLPYASVVAWSRERGM